MKILILAALLAWTASAAQAQSVPLTPALSGLGILVGEWSSGKGQVKDTGGTSTGSSSIEAEAGGAVLLRRDHTRLFDAAGKASGEFDQIMMIYAEAGGLRADYTDGTHVIHYTTVEVKPGPSVVFNTAPNPGAPSFRLAYTLTAPNVLAVSFSIAPPGQAAFHDIATGTLTKAN